MAHPAIQQIIQLFESKGDSMYGGEAVTQLEHALQAAYLAKLEYANDSLIAASLLHDIGHLLHDLPEMASEDGIDDIHEELAANFLTRYFTDEVVEPVKLHVQAKRYLCATEEGYYERLSQPSKTSLEFQGGIMNAVEVESFTANPYFRDAIALRKWDDLAKDPDFVTPDLSDFISSLKLTLKNSMSVLMVVFDMAGTTVDEDNVVYKTLQDAIVHYSFPVTLAQVLEFGAGKEKLQAIIDILENTGYAVNSENIDLIFAYFNERLAKNYETLNVKPLPDVERTFKELKERNVKVVLNTGYNRKTAESLIVKLGWRMFDQFDLLVTASDVKNNRPQPDMILLAMSKLSISDPKKVIKIGDSTVDIREGQNAECLLSVGITTGAHTHEQLSEAHPDYIIDNIYELIGIIDSQGLIE